MSDRGPYDPYLPSDRSQNAGQGASGSDGPSGGQNHLLESTQRELDGTLKKMQENLQAATGRGERLDEMGHKTDTLANNASNFRGGARKIRKQMWWKNAKMSIWITVGIIILILIIVIPSVIASKRN